MKVQDVAIFEQSNRTTILLVREGLFWRAYGRSAQLFCTHLRSFQVKRRTVKAGGDRSAALTASLRSPTAQHISPTAQITEQAFRSVRDSYLGLLGHFDCHRLASRY